MPLGAWPHFHALLHLNALRVPAGCTYAFVPIGAALPLAHESAAFSSRLTCVSGSVRPSPMATFFELSGNSASHSLNSFTASWNTGGCSGRPDVRRLCCSGGASRRDPPPRSSICRMKWPAFNEGMRES